MSSDDSHLGHDSEGSVAARSVETLFRDRRVNAGLFWATVGALLVFAGVRVAVGDPLSTAMAAGVAAVAVVVPVTYRSSLVTLPWELVAIAAVPTVGRAFVPGVGGIVASYLAVAAVALIVAVELHAFAPGISMSYDFAAAFVVVTTLAAAGVWALARWLAGLTLGTTPLTDETALMWEFVGSTVAGVLAGVALRPYFDRQPYLRRLPRSVAGRTADEARSTAPPEDEENLRHPISAGSGGDRSREAPPVVGAVRWFRGNLRDTLGITPNQQAAAAKLMEYVLVGLLFVGLERRAVGIVVNAGVALAIVQLPAVLERDYQIPMDPAVTLWITAAAFLHALGTVGIPGSGATFYRTVGWWDHLTHALSASVVAAVGYATVRAIDRHSAAVSLPPRFAFVFVISFTLAFGVLWEVLEFGLGFLGTVTGASVLTQYGLEDTMLDLLFDLGGGVVAGVWGTAHLSNVTGALVERLENRQGG